MLKQEERKLKTEDIRQLQLRQQKNEMNKKLQIIQDHSEARDTIDKWKVKQELAIQQKVVGMVWKGRVTGELKSGMNEWAQSGFRSARKASVQLVLEQSPSIKSLMQKLSQETR